MRRWTGRTGAVVLLTLWGLLGSCAAPSSPGPAPSVGAVAARDTIANARSGAGQPPAEPPEVRRVGISSRGDTHEITMRLLLRRHGIDPNAVVYATIGSGAARISAIEAGAVDAATLAPRDFAQLSQPRGPLLADMEKEVKLVYT